MTRKASQKDQLTQLLAIINQLNLKAFNSESRDALTFIIVNDTRKLLSYDRALLWRLDPILGNRCVAISGHATVEQESSVVRDTGKYIEAIEDLANATILPLDKGIPGKTGNQNDISNPSAVWLPIHSQEGDPVRLGLWLERWSGTSWQPEETRILEHLLQGYSAAWNRHSHWWRMPRPVKRLVWIGVALLFAILFLVPVPLRVVGPCEVIPNNPFLVTAPLDGIIAEMHVQPGELVKKNQLLFSYDKRVPLQELEVAKKQVDIARTQLNRVMTLGLSDPKSLNETAVWELELAKEQVKLEIAEYRANQLNVDSPIKGITLFDNPDEWRGKPVKVGERILVVSQPDETKVKISVPERDNIVINPEKPVKIILNVDPTRSFFAHLDYVSDYSALSEKGVPSFSAEAHWIDPPKNIKLGLKGTAILYGEEVSIFYWIFRKPWAALRELIGF